MNKIFFLLAAVIVFSACSPYQTVLKEDDIQAKYTFADSLYKQGKYKKAIKLWEQIVPLYRGRPQAERVSYLYADTYYQIGDYYLSGYQFERFVKAFPESTKREEAAFKSAESYYTLSPTFNLDQAETKKAMEKLQGYINAYPDSENVDKANMMVKELQTKLERKAFEIAKGFNKIGASRGTFPNAIAAFDTFLLEYPGSVYREDALFWKFDSAYQLASGSIARLQQERYESAKAAYQTLIKYFPEGKYNEQATKMIEDINNELAASETVN